MAFQFERKEAVKRGIRRLTEELIEDALDCLSQSRRPEAIHGVRKNIKKARAVLRMIRRNVPRKTYNRQIALLKEAAILLSAARDAYVKGAALENLTQSFKGQLPSNVFGRLADQLRGDLQQETRRFLKNKSASAVKRVLRRVPRGLDSLDLDAKGWKAIGPGIRSAYASGQRSYRAVLKRPSTENLHEMRKRVKDLWYGLRLLEPVSPKEMNFMTDRLKDLGECLGDDQDLYLLRATVEDVARKTGNSDSFLALYGLIENRRRHLQMASLEIAARFYVEKPGVFCKRLFRHWKTWRSKG